MADDVKGQILEPIFEKRVKKGSTIYSDTASCYDFLEEAGYHRIHHNLNAYERVIFVVNFIVEKTQKQILKIFSYFSLALENPYAIYHI